MLINIRDHWKATLSKESKQLEIAKRDLIILESLIKWITIVQEEMKSLNDRLRLRYSELVDDLELIWKKK
jgi:hypothetical protein